MFSFFKSKQSTSAAEARAAAQSAMAVRGHFNADRLPASREELGLPASGGVSQWVDREFAGEVLF